MTRTLEQLGLGVDLVDLNAPVGEDNALAEPCRRLALWMLLHASAGRALIGALRTIFQRSREPRPELVDALFRQHTLLARFVDHELPMLARQLRVEMATEREWMRHPRGGWVDLPGTLRAQPVGVPESWLVQRIERAVDTPVNRLVAAILRAAEHRIGRLSELYRVRKQPVPELITGTGTALGRFFRDHPIGRLRLDGDRSLADYRRDAARRASELARVASLIDWWRETEKLRIESVQEILDGASIVGVSVHAAYELAILVGLLSVLGRRLRHDRAAAPTGGLVFRGNRGTVTLQVAPPHPLGHPGPGPTAMLTLDAAASRTLLLNIRNIGVARSGPYLAELGLACQRPGTRCDGLLITPTAVPTPLCTDHVQWCEFPPTLDAPALLARWRDVLRPYILDLQTNF
jgi:hypothetical protein